MKKYILIILILFAGFFSGLAYGQNKIMRDNIVEHKIISGVIANYIQRITVSITAVDPNIPVENRPMHVFFTISNHTKEAHTGWVAATVTSNNDNPVDSNWWQASLAPGQDTEGAVTVITPKAGKDHKIELYYFEKKTGGEFPLPDVHIASASDVFNSAARFNFKLNSFYIDKTRASHEDTDYVTLAAAVGGKPAGTPVLSLKIGDVNDGNHVFRGIGKNGNPVDKVETGPIDLIPGISPALDIVYSITNIGATVERAANIFFNNVSDATEGVLEVYTRSDGWKAVNEFTKYINSFTFAGCDGPVVVEAYRISSTEIDDKTLNGDFTPSPSRYTGDDYTSQRGCGGTSNYAVSWTLQRLRDASDILHITPNQADVKVNDNLKLSADAKDVSWRLLHGPGRIDKGVYYSPSDLSEGNFVVISGTEITTTVGNIGRSEFMFINLQQ